MGGRYSDVIVNALLIWQNIFFEKDKRQNKTCLTDGRLSIREHAATMTMLVVLQRLDGVS